MNEPNAQQMERLREIANQAICDCAATGSSPLQVIRDLAITVWREAQGEKEFFRKQAQCNEQVILELRKDRNQLEASLRLAVESLITYQGQPGYFKKVRETLSTIRASHPQLMEEKK
jgi:hypothetical protein